MGDRRPAAFAIAWGGTAAFAASLLWFLYCYLIRFGDHPAGAAASAVPIGSNSTAAPIVFNVLLFSGFALHHSVLARAGAKRRIERLVSPELERSLYTWVASVLFAFVCWWWQPVPGTLYALPGTWRALGYTVQAAGLILTIQASRMLDVLDLSGVRPVQRAVNNTPPAHVPLKTTGLYGFVRHPLYFAWVLLVFGAPEMTATRFVFAATSTLYLALAIPWEERGLVRTFGGDYIRYQRDVRWRMLPGLY